MRPATDGSPVNSPTELFNRYGAVDHTLVNDAGRVYPLPPSGILNSAGVPSTGLYTVTEPTPGNSLKVWEEKLSQMLSAMEFVASGLQALVPSSVTGMRFSAER